jgi:hypothetical protein
MSDTPETHADPVVAPATDVLTQVEDVAKQAAGDAVQAAADVAIDDVEKAVDEDLGPMGPPITHPVFDSIKAWVRRELDLIGAGHSEQTRKVQNP